MFNEYTTLIDTRNNVYKVTYNMVNYRKHPKMAHGGRCLRDSSKRCEFHKDIGHTANECRHLKDEIESLT